MKPILYSFRRCPYAMRARLAVKYSQVIVELREVDLNDIPSALSDISSAQTVPVILESSGNVIDESWDIVKWALKQNDPDGWLGENQCHLNDAEMLVETNDFSFKIDLDHYKYADRHPEYPMEHYRSEGEEFLAELEARLEMNAYLSSSTIALSDIAVFPFIRQFALVDKDWFDSAPYPKLQVWLDSFLASDLFESVMHKYSLWQEGATPIHF